MNQRREARQQRRIERRTERNRKPATGRNRANQYADTNEPMIADYSVKRSAEPFEPVNITQAQYATQIVSRRVTFGVGAAGTGKSYVALSLAAEALMAGEIDRIIVVRPLVEAGEEVGTLPGEMDEKISPYFAPALDILNERLGKGHVAGLMKAGRIVLSPLAYLRGTTFSNCWVILDEGQNTTVAQMKMLLTRLGRDSKLVINGDTRQCDLPANVESGLSDAVSRFKHNRNFGIVQFFQSDIVRDPLVKEIIVAYEGDDGSLAE